MSRKVPKDYIVTIEDFMVSLPAIDHMHTRLKHKVTEYILFLNLNEQANGIVFVLTDGFSIYWIKQYEYHDFENIRYKLGMEGNYAGFFDIFKDSFFNKCLNLEINNDVAVIQVKYQISKGVTLSGQYDLGSGTTLAKDPLVFMKINKSFLFDLTKTVELLNKRNEDVVKEMNERTLAIAGDASSKAKRNHENGLGISLISGGFHKKDSQKQKAKTDLINPNRKKVTSKGLKFNVETVNLSAVQEAAD